MYKLIWNWHGKTIISRGDYRHGAIHVLYSNGICIGELEFDIMKKLMAFQGFKRE